MWTLWESLGVFITVVVVVVVVVVEEVVAVVVDVFWARHVVILMESLPVPTTHNAALAAPAPAACSAGALSDPAF